MRLETKLMPEIIEWLDESGEQIVWRHPRDRLQWGDYLTVKQSQVAVFMKDGKAFDLVEPGKLVIKTNNIPMLTSILSTIVGYDKNPFHAEVIFVGTNDFKGKFGGRSQTQELAPLQYYGDYVFNVTDPQKFVYQVVGNRGVMSQASFDEFFKSFFQNQLMSTLSDFSIVNVLKESTETAQKVKEILNEELADYGIGLSKINFANIDTTPEYRDRLFWMRSGVDANKLATFSGMKDVAGAMPDGGGAAFGMGHAMMGNMLGGQQNEQKAEQIKQSGNSDEGVLKCNQCGGLFSPAAKFCPACGDPTDDELKGTKKFCIECGNQIDAGSKFCSACGKKY